MKQLLESYESLTEVKSEEQTSIHYMRQNIFSLYRNSGRPHAFKRGRDTLCPAYGSKYKLQIHHTFQHQSSIESKS